jgi:Stress responsive A/B Barrel Domain
MTRQSRRNFLASASLLTLGTAAKGIPMQTAKPAVIHHVFFWLKNPKSTEDRDKLVEGVKTLEKIESVRSIHVGIPAATPARAVVDASYHVTELIFFDDVEGQSVYQDHPVHKAFVETYGHLWKKVVVYDSATV